MRLHSGSSGQPFLFTGEQTDEALGTVYLRARYYDPKTGRFISPDMWLGDARMSQTLNRYAYVTNNPVNLTDVTGHCPEEKQALQDIARWWGFESLDAVSAYLGWAGGTEYKLFGLFKVPYMRGVLKMPTGQLTLPLQGLKNSGKLAAVARVGNKLLIPVELAIEAHQLNKREDLTGAQKLTKASLSIVPGVGLVDLASTAVFGKSASEEASKWWASERNPVVRGLSDLILKVGGRRFQEWSTQPSWLDYY